MSYRPELLKRAIRDSGKKVKFLASRLGLSPYGLQLKIDGKNEFKNSEIIAICEELNIEPLMRNAIFFG